MIETECTGTNRMNVDTRKRDKCGANENEMEKDAISPIFNIYLLNGCDL